MVDSNKVYVLEIDYDNFKSFVPKDLSVSVRCKGTPLKWSDTLAIDIDEEDMGVPEADISMLNIGSFVISSALYESFFEEFEGDIEFLPLDFCGRKYYLCNVIKIVDCLNKDKVRFNEFGAISKIVFDKDRIPKNGFFKISEDNFTSIFCTENVKNIFDSNFFSGAEFEGFSLD